MTNQEFENLIKESLKTDTLPSRGSFSHVLSSLENHPVTKSKEVRYTNKTVTSNIIINKFADIVSIWKSKRLVLVPSLVLVLLVSIFSLSPYSFLHNESLQTLAERDALIEELENDVSEDEILTSFDVPDINDLGIINNEI